MMPKPNLLLDMHVEQLEAVKIQEEVEKLKTTVENDQKNKMEELINFKKMYENEKDISNDLE